MIPEFLVPDVLLSMCGDRLSAVVDEPGGEAGPFLVGAELAAGAQAEDLLRDLFDAVDPTILLLALCGWRTIALEIWAPGSDGGTLVERIELLASSLSRPTGEDGPNEARWYVPVLRVAAEGEQDEGEAWRLRFMLTPQPLVDDANRVGIAGESLVLGTLGGAGVVTPPAPGTEEPSSVRTALDVAWTGDARDFAVGDLNTLLNDPEASVSGWLAELLAGAAGGFTTRLETLSADGELPAGGGLLGAWAPARWSIDVPDTATLTPTLQEQLQPVVSWFSDSWVGQSLETARGFFFQQAQRSGELAAASRDELEAVLGDQLGEVKGTLREAWTNAKPWLQAVSLKELGGAWSRWIRERLLGFRAWLRLHNEGVLDLLRPLGLDIRGIGYLAVDAALRGERPTLDQLPLLTAAVRRYVSDSRSTVAEVVLLGGADVGGFWIAGLSGVLSGLKESVADAVAGSPFFFGNWDVIGPVGVDDDTSGQYDILVLPQPDVAPLSQGLWEWTLDDGYRPAAELSARRRAALEAQLAGADVTEERRVEVESDYAQLPEPLSMLTAINRSLDRIETGNGVRVGHPDTGLLQLSPPTPTNPMGFHSALSDRAVLAAGAPYEAGGPPYLWPDHGTTTGSCICGFGTFPGEDPTTGQTRDMDFSGVAPGATLTPYSATQSVLLLAKSWDPLADVDVAGVAEAIRFLCGSLDDEQRADVISISLGYKYDVFAAVSLSRAVAVGVVTSGGLLIPLTPGARSLAVQTAALLDLRDACQEAWDRGVIVCAAAGQAPPIPGAWLGGPTYPGAFGTVVGCAGLLGHGAPWTGSLRGQGVSVSVPCVGAWGCRWDDAGQEVVMQSKGTSYSTALTAGVAALWLEKHGAGLRAAGHNPAEIFMDVLAGCGLDPVTDGSGAPLDGWGYGRLDAAKILDYPVSY